jgi:hypothetical protein
MRWDDDNSELAEYDALKDLVLTRLPYAYDDGEDPPNEANAEECVEYAADEIVRLRAENVGDLLTDVAGQMMGMAQAHHVDLRVRGGID